MIYAPVIITVYTRYNHIKRCIESLLKNNLASKTNIYIISDAAAKSEHKENVQKVRNYLSNISGFKSINIDFIKHNSRLEKKDYVIPLIEQQLNKSGKVIVLEDDIVVSRHFLQFMNDSLEFYKDDKRIGAVSGFQLPIKIPTTYKDDVYLGKRFSPWGFGMRKEWFDAMKLVHFDRYTIAIKPENINKFKSVGSDILEILKADSEETISAFDVRVCYHQIMNNLYTIFPVISMTQNIGLDGTGEHCGKIHNLNVKINNNQKYNLQLKHAIDINQQILKKIKRFHDEYFLCFPIKFIRTTLIKKIKSVLVKLYLYNLVRKIYLYLKGNIK